MILNVITRVTRLDNLKKIKDTVLTDKLEVLWHLVFDTNYIEHIPAEILKWEGVKFYYERSNKDAIRPLIYRLERCL